MDSQLIGQAYLWNKSKYGKEYGKCLGVIVDLIVKTKEVSCFLEQVTIDDKAIASFENDMKYISFERELCEHTGHWPRKRHNCSKYNRLCTFFDYCLSNGEDETGLARKKGKTK
jgi:hypothetical protein